MMAAAPLPMNALARNAKVTAEGANSVGGAVPGGSGAGGAAGASAGAQLRLQQAFKVTPLFKTVKTGADGSVSVDFAAPDNLGRFVVRAYVAAPKTQAKAAAAASSGSNSAVAYGAGESALAVRRTVSLVPSLPRQVRVGDSFSAGVLVEAPGTVSNVTVVVSAAVQQPASGSSSSSVLSLGQDSSRIVTLSPGQPQQEVRFAFEADSIGVQNITFTATANTGGLRGPTNRGLRHLLAAEASSAAGAVRALRQFLANRRAGNTQAAPAGNVADQVQLQVPVNGKQGSVVIATSFAVRGSSSGNSWQEGMELPRAELGSGSISLIAGVGSLPAIQVGRRFDQSCCAACNFGCFCGNLPRFLSCARTACACVSVCLPWVALIGQPCVCAITLSVSPQ